jgi:hypothetical protein
MITVMWAATTGTEPRPHRCRSVTGQTPTTASGASVGHRHPPGVVTVYRYRPAAQRQPRRRASPAHPIRSGRRRTAPARRPHGPGPGRQQAGPIYRPPPQRCSWRYSPAVDPMLLADRSLLPVPDDRRRPAWDHREDTPIPVNGRESRAEERIPWHHASPWIGCRAAAQCDQSQASRGPEHRRELRTVAVASRR